MTYTDFPPFFETVRHAMLLNESIFEMIQTVQGGLWIAWIIVLVAGVSEALGQSIVLFMNHVTPRRFGLALFASAFSHVIGYLFWTATIWAIGRYVFERPAPIYNVAAFVGLAYAPRLLSFFILTPFLGNMFSLLLSIWSLYVTIVAIGVGFELTLWQAAATSGLGWFVIQVWYRTLGKPLYRIGQWLENHVAGVPLKLTLRDVSRLRRPVPALWHEWKEQLEQRVVQLSDVSRSSSLTRGPIASSTIRPAANGHGKGR